MGSLVAAVGSFLFARAAGGPSELLFVRGATHGAYLEADPAGYSRALLTFLGNGAGAGEPPRPVGGRWEH